MKILATLALLAAAPAFAQVQTLVHKDDKRKYIVYTPAGYAAAPDKAWPVVFNFHGGGMTMAEQMLYTQMNRAADRHGYIAVYPAGIKADWNVGFGMPYREGTDDIGFTRALVAKLKQDYRVDGTRLYATGLSRGGFFALRLAAELPDTFAAVAAVGAPLPQPVLDHLDTKAPAAPVGVLLLHGTADQVVAYDGKAGGYLSARATFDFWRQRNGAAAPSRRVLDTDPADGTTVTFEEAGGPHAVALVTIEDGGHTWPGADAFNVGLPIGKTTRDIDANDAMWRFFARHRR